MALTLRSSTSFTNLRDHKTLRIPEESHNIICFTPNKSPDRTRAFAPIRAQKLMHENERFLVFNNHGKNQNLEKLHEMAIPLHQTTDSKVPVFVMLPLDTVSIGGRLNRPKVMNASLMALKNSGVEGVMVDAWWGLVEKDGPQKYNWDGYSELIQMVQKHGLKLQVVMSFHQCGGNVGDSCSIPLPPWVLEEISKNPDLVYTDRSGRRNPEYISLGCDSLPVLRGRTPIQVYSDFMRSFQERFKDYLGRVIVEIQVGMGPCGELRYPSYPESNGTWKFPGIGEFQCYDKYMQASLKAAAVSIGRAEWGSSGPHDSGQYNQFPEDTGFFQRDGTWDQEYGQFFLSWYSGLLLDHGDKLLEAAKGIFKGTGAKLSGKIAGIHWHYKSRSHAAELTAGYYNTRNRDSYLATAQMFSKHEAIFNFTCMEMKDCEQQSNANSSPQGLVLQVKRATKTAETELSGENALERYDSAAYDQVLATSRSDSGNGLNAFTFLRMNKKLYESENWRWELQLMESSFVVSARASPFRFFGSSFPNTVNLSRLNTAKQRLVIRNACDFDQNQGSPSLPSKDFMKEVGISCSKNGAYFSDEISQFRRRDLTFSAGMFVIGSSGLFAENANAADLIQRRQRSEFQSSVKGTLYNAIKAKPDLISPILSLALNDAITYDKATKTGGPNGSIRFSSEIDRPENIGLSSALSLLEELKKEIDAYSKGGPISIADLIQFAAQAAIKSTFLDAAVRKCGGNEEKGRLLYTAYGSNGQWGQFDKIFGRADAQEPDPEGRVPQWDKASVKEMKDKFSSVGLGPRQLAVLSAFLGPDQVATENLLATDSDVAPWVQKYQRSRETVSQTDYEVDLITTLTKLSSLGQSINYEAYTYPVKKVDLSKLRL